MAGKGAFPKPVLSRPNDQARAIAASTKLSADGILRGPELPDGDWHERTLAWWNTWRLSPQSIIFTDTDWDALAETALLHSRMWSGEMSVASELRLRAAKFGATVEDRARLKMIIDNEALEVSPVVATVKPNRRRRLLKAVGDAP